MKTYIEINLIELTCGAKGTPHSLRNVGESRILVTDEANVCPEDDEGVAFTMTPDEWENYDHSKPLYDNIFAWNISVEEK